MRSGLCFWILFLLQLAYVNQRIQPRAPVPNVKKVAAVTPIQKFETARFLSTPAVNYGKPSKDVAKVRTEYYVLRSTIPVVSTSSA
jgi:hypothetical protein